VNRKRQLRGERFEKVLTKDGAIKQIEVADEFGVARATVSRWCAGERLPEPDMIEAICTTRGVSADYLFMLNGDSSRTLEHQGVSFVMVPRVKGFEHASSVATGKAKAKDSLPFTEGYLTSLLDGASLDYLVVVDGADLEGNPAQILLNIDYGELSEGMVYAVMTRGNEAMIGKLHKRGAVCVFRSRRFEDDPVIIGGADDSDDPGWRVIGQVVATISQPQAS
jgi:transcriptional regulator with XRE-family HTH domain